MKRFRRVLMWVGLAGIVLLVTLSVIGAFLGPERATAMFRSIPLAAVWVAITVLLLVGLVSFARAFGGAGLPATLAGVLLILAGAIYPSPLARALRGKLSGQSAIHKGLMHIEIGATENSIYDTNDRGRSKQLNFALKLERFHVEYYPPPDPKWSFHAAVEDGNAPDGLVQQFIAPELGQIIAVPFTDVQLEVLEYLTAQTPQAAPTLVISTEEQTQIIPLDTNEIVRIGLLDARLKILRVFRNFRVCGEGKELRAEESPGPGRNPAVEVEIEFADGRAMKTYAFPPALTMRLGHRLSEGALLMYLPPPPDRHGRIAPPAVKLRLRRGGRVVTGWLAGEEHSQYERLPLLSVYESEHQWSRAGAPEIVLRRPHQAVRDYKSELIVMRNGTGVARKVVEVNDPLHYGGYHFYQAGGDPDRHDYIVLMVVSDSGLIAVCTGFALLAGGVVWSAWVRPVFSRVRGETKA